MKPFILISTLLIIWIVIAFQVIVPEPIAPKQVSTINVIWNRANATTTLYFGLPVYSTDGIENPDPDENRQPKYLTPMCASGQRNQVGDPTVTNYCLACHCGYGNKNWLYWSNNNSPGYENPYCYDATGQRVPWLSNPVMPEYYIFDSGITSIPLGD
jgi:hypothetical protein